MLHIGPRAPTPGKTEPFACSGFCGGPVYLSPIEATYARALDDSRVSCEACAVILDPPPVAATVRLPYRDS